MDLNLGAGIPDVLMWPLTDGKHIVSVPHYDGFLVDRGDDGMAADFAIRLKGGTLAALDKTTREVKRLTKSVPNVNKD